MKFLTDPSPFGLKVCLLLICIITLMTVLLCKKASGEQPVNIDGLQKVISNVVDKYPRHDLYKKQIEQSKFAHDIYIASTENNVPPLLIAAMAYHENSFRYKSKIGPGGEVGPIQVHPSTAKQNKCETKTRIGLLRCGAKILSDKYHNCGNWVEALAAYASKSGKCSAIKISGPRYAARIRISTWNMFKEIKNVTLNPSPPE